MSGPSDEEVCARTLHAVMNGLRRFSARSGVPLDAIVTDEAEMVAEIHRIDAYVAESLRSQRGESR